MGPIVDVFVTHYFAVASGTGPRTRAHAPKYMTHSGCSRGRALENKQEKRDVDDIVLRPRMKSADPIATERATTALSN